MIAASTTLSAIRIRPLSTAKTTLSRLLIAIAGLLLLNTVSAADFGFGASFKSGESSIYLPVHATKNFMIEPYFRLTDDELFAASSKFSTEDTIIGVGLFGVFNSVENASVYLGVRTAYLKQEQKIEQTIITVVGSSVITTRTEQDGYSIAPTLGFEYYIINRLTIGAEVAWEYSKLDASASVDTISIPVPLNADSELKSNGTRTNIILRFYF